jgi:hypothetical protein
MDKNVVYIHNGILFNSKRDNILLFAARYMGIEGFMFDKIN